MTRIGKLPFSVFIACFVLLIVIIFYLGPTLQKGDYFRDNLLPELLGFCLEGILFVAVIGALQAIRESNRVNRLRQSLIAELSFLGEVMKNCVRNSDLGSSPNSKIDFCTASSTAVGMEALQNEAEEKRKRTGRKGKDQFAKVSKSVVDELEESPITHLRRLQSIAPVAAEISEDFLSDWLYLTDLLYDLTLVDRFDSGELETWGEQLEWEYKYAQLVVLFQMLGKMNVPEYCSPQI